jgi:hypothetical protein
MLFWMQCGLPILTTVTTEISHILVDNDLALGVPPKKDKLLSKKILDACSNAAEVQQMAAKAKNFAYDYFTFEETIRPLREWVENPQRAADNLERDNLDWQPLNTVDLMWHKWAFPEQRFSLDNGGGLTQLKPIARRSVSNWWHRIWGS